MQLTIEADEELLRDFCERWTNHPCTTWGKVAAAIDQALPKMVMFEISLEDAKLLADWHPPFRDNYYGRLRAAARKALGC